MPPPSVSRRLQVFSFAVAQSSRFHRVKIFIPFFSIGWISSGSSRSDGVKVAVGFNPRKDEPKKMRRVATVEFNRRYATCVFPLAAFRGLKSTATCSSSLRDSVKSRHGNRGGFCGLAFLFPRFPLRGNYRGVSFHWVEFVVRFGARGWMKQYE